MAEEDKKKNSLSYDNDSMKWLDSNGNVVDHPRYKNSPQSLDGKSFIKGYLRAVGKKMSLNEYMKTNQKFSAAEVTKAAKDFRKILNAATGEDFKVLTRRKSKTDSAKKKKEKAVKESMKELLQMGLEF